MLIGAALVVLAGNSCFAVHVFELARFKSRVVAELVPPTFRVLFGLVIVSPKLGPIQDVPFGS